MSKKGKKQFKRLSPGAARTISTPPPSAAITSAPVVPPLPSLNLDYLHAARIVVRDYTRLQIILVGCGGIGAYLAQHIGRLVKVLAENTLVNFTLVDPDVVEEPNLGRQLFCAAEIGESKAVALARRYGQAFGVQTMAYATRFSADVIHDNADLVILVGCVDNAAARAGLHAVLAQNDELLMSETNLPRVWWLDCGNLKDTGRVLLGSAHSANHLRGAFRDEQVCYALPSPGLQFPSLLIPPREETDSAREMSCAELAAANLQSLNINSALAVQAADMLTRLLLTHDLKRYQCVVNLASGSVKSFYITQPEIAREIGRDPDFVRRKSPLRLHTLTTPQLMTLAAMRQAQA